MALHPLCPNRIQFAWWALQLFALWGTELPVRHWHWHRQQESGAASAADERPQQWLDHQFAPGQIQANWAGRLASPRLAPPNHPLTTHKPAPPITHRPSSHQPSFFSRKPDQPTAALCVQLSILAMSEMEFVLLAGDGFEWRSAICCIRPATPMSCHPLFTALHHQPSIVAFSGVGNSFESLSNPLKTRPFFAQNYWQCSPIEFKTKLDKYLLSINIELIV